uniref:deoxyribose-phosphate aldolase n=1 Tax=Laticauda laticaudata TaxID=8630 RepID=A0A8C5RTA8_LATLA
VEDLGGNGNKCCIFSRSCLKVIKLEEGRSHIPNLTILGHHCSTQKTTCKDSERMLTWFPPPLLLFTYLFFPDLYEEIRQFRQACGDIHMKTILGTGELGSLTNVYKASLVAMMAGSDFIKTSTGKETVNATFPVGLVMVRAIRDYYWKTGYKVGFKPAGGIRKAKEALIWLSLMKEELGEEWLKPELFRLGASTLLGDIERQVRCKALMGHK